MQTMTEQIVYLALGSNLGDRARNLYTGLRSNSAYTVIDETSHLYQSPAAYVTTSRTF